jgi:hypothetical protein
MTMLEKVIKAAIRKKAVFMTMEEAVAEFKKRPR